MNTRKTRAKRIKLPKNDDDFEYDDCDSFSPSNGCDLEDQEEIRKSRIRDSNKEYARRMTILQTWSNYWSDYTIREGEAYPALKARDIIKRTKKIICPIESCRKSFTSVGGLKYHYARCNIERSFKCKVCDPPHTMTTRGELLRHMILTHHRELPPLDPDQSEIAQSFLTGENKVDKYRREKSGGETEAPFNPHRIVKAFSDLQDRVYESLHPKEQFYTLWRSDSADWDLVTHEFDRSKFYPPEFESVRFRTGQSNQNWLSLKTGESIPLIIDKIGSTSSTVFYTGGKNTASAWLPKNPHYKFRQDVIAIAIDCHSMDQNRSYRMKTKGEGCIQFWILDANVNDPKNHPKVSLGFIIAHSYGTIYDMLWCPLGTSWEPEIKNEVGSKTGRIGLLALACGDGQVRVISVPHLHNVLLKTAARISESTIEASPIYRVKPVATLIHPGVGPSTDYQPVSCKTLAWSLEANQRYIVAGYTNGTLALFDLQSTSPIIYSNINGCHIHHPIKSTIAHGAPVTGVAISTDSKPDSNGNHTILIASGSTDRFLKIWNVMHDSSLETERAPITKLLWDFRLRGTISATDTAFTSFNNRVSYRFPQVEGHQNITISVHRSVVWGLANSMITNAIATSDGAGEVFVMPQTFNRSSHKRDRSLLSIHSLYTMIPIALNLATDPVRSTVLRFATSSPDYNYTSIKNQDENEIETNEEEGGEENDLEANADFSAIERTVANKPTTFLLPIEHRPVETYSKFKTKFGLEFIDYDQVSTKRPNSKIPESCARGGNLKNVYCDRSCDYPFSSIAMVNWSPNVNTFPYLLSATHVGLCRLDRVQVVENIYKNFVDNLLQSKFTDAQ